MVTYRLIAQEDEESGVLGLRILGTKEIAGAYNMATEGLLIAHDIIEHHKIADIGTIGDELRALGSIWYVRGQWCDLRRDSRGSSFTPEQSIASDVVNMGRSIVPGYTKYYAKVPKVCANRCAAIESLRYIIEEARKDLPSELEGEEYTREALDKYLEDALKFMVYGYNKAHRRYSPLGNRFAANNLFWKIAEAVDSVLKYEIYQGQEFNLKVSYSKSSASCEEAYDNYE